MRLWSLSPKYLDSKGLISLWREALLARKVLSRKTKGYKNHPQLQRFKNSKYPLDVINKYLEEIYKEAKKRNYHFDKTKLKYVKRKIKVKVTDKQLIYEYKHLLDKLKKRKTNHNIPLKTPDRISHFRIFKVIKGEIEPWEKVK